MQRRAFVGIAAVAASGLSPPAEAQAQGKPRRIALLSGFSRPNVNAFLAELRPELEKLGWSEGRNIVILEPRVSDSVNERLPAAAADIVAQKPDLILVQSVPATRALMRATQSLPIVMYAVGNPVELGLVADHHKPGGNVTGSSYLADELTRKLLQFIKEAAPRLRTVALFSNPSNEAAPALIRLVRVDEKTLGMQVQVLEVTSRADFDPAFAAIRRAGTEAIVLPPEPLIQTNREAIALFAKAHGLPLAIVGNSLATSGLLAYGPARLHYAQITAGFVDRILRGAKPGDLPIERPTRFSLMVNLKAAADLGLAIPQSMLLRADEVIQ